MTREEVYNLINDERDYQNRKWPIESSQKNTPAESAIYMRDYLDEGFHRLGRNPGYQGLLDCIRKVTALGVACMEASQTPVPGRKADEIATVKPATAGSFQTN